MESDLANNVGESPRKRQRLSPSIESNTTSTPQHLSRNIPMIDPNKLVADSTGFQLEREAQVGILHFVSSTNSGFSGILKQRYTDFLVNEITPDGHVVHLESTAVPKVNKQETKQEPKQEPKPDLGAGIEAAASEPIKEVTPAPIAVEVGKPAVVADVVAQSDAEKAQQKVASISDVDKALVAKFFGDEIRDQMLTMYEKILSRPTAKAATFGSLTASPITDRAIRTEMHHNVRRIFDSRFETSADADGIVKISAALKTTRQPGQQPNPNQNGNNRGQIKGKLGWQELGGEHLHFSLYKENKDTMEVVSFIAKKLNARPKSFAFAGTKDRRGVTVQRVSVFRQHADRLANMNKILLGSKLGGFKYEKHGLELGELNGNEFHITLRDCRFEGDETLSIAERVNLGKQVLGSSVADLGKHGFLNYFGLQRFGTFSTGTDEVGKKILQEDFEGAVWAILSYGETALNAALNPESQTTDDLLISRDDKARAHAIHIFKTTGKSHGALEKLPRKFSGEASIIRHLGSRPTDFVGALLTISRNLRLMYVHAYQSLVWNYAASERWAKYGSEVVAGDLVLVETSAQTAAAAPKDEVDENGEIVVLPAADDAATSLDDIYQRARPLTEEEAKSGKWTIFDVVLPTPGYDIEYPANAIGDFYKDFMGSEAGGKLDPSNMRRKQKDFSLSGSYRKVLAQVGNNLSFDVRTYTSNNEQMVETDLEKLNKKNPHYKPREYQSRAPLPDQKNAWRNAPAKIMAEEKAANEKHHAEEMTRDPADISQPIIKETFIQTSADGGQTGHRETMVMEGVESSSTPITTPKRIVPAETLKDSPASINTDSSGGVALVEDIPVSAPVLETGLPEDAPKNNKRAAEEPAEEVAKEEAKIAVIVKFQLGSSQYATMALRELMKQGGVKTYKPDFSSGR